MKISEKFGLSVALVTPFQSDGHVALEKMLDHARWCLDNGCRGVTLMGTTGEATSISPAERTELLTEFQLVGITREQLITGIFATDVRTAVPQISEAVDRGFSKVLVAPPYYIKPVSDEGVWQWYLQVLTECADDITGCLIYNLPSQTGVTISPALISRLRERFGDLILGVKDSSGDMTSTEAFLKEHRDIAILVGDERQLARSVANGGQGAISGVANLYPGALKKLIDDATANTYIHSLVDELIRYPIVPAIKYLMAIMHNDDSWTNVRAPLVSLSNDEKNRLELFYRNAN